jgi:hypothetical protein
MFKYQKALGLLGLVLICACGSTSTKSGTVPSSTSMAAASPTPAPLDNSVLIGHTDQPSRVIVMRRDGSVVATLSGTGVVDQHAVGSYVVVGSAGSGKAWSIDASGAVADVAPPAAKLLASYPYSPPLIVDSSTAIIGCGNSTQGCSTQRVDLTTGTVRTLLTVPAVSGQAAMEFGASLTALDLSPDAHTVWLRKVSSVAGSWRLAIVGLDLQTGAVTSHELPDALIGEHDLAISRDGKSVAGQEDAGTSSANLAIAHLHVVSVPTGVDADVQGTAPYVRGWPPPGPPTIVFAPNDGEVAWWGGFDNGDTDYRINFATIGGAGRPLFRLDDTDLAHGWMKAVFWLDAATLAVQVESTTPFLVDTTTGAMRSLPAGLGTLDAVLY